MRLTRNQEDIFYFLFRILVGLLFVQHGAQKLFGAFGGAQVELMSLFGAAGIIELLGGIFIFFGLFTRWTALVAGIEMLVAYFMVHIGKDLVPIVNQGELALLFLACFLILFSMGGRKWALDNLIFRQRR